jgi:hypothetical protein
VTGCCDTYGASNKAVLSVGISLDLVRIGLPGVTSGAGSPPRSPMVLYGDSVLGKPCWSPGFSRKMGGRTGSSRDSSEFRPRSPVLRGPEPYLSPGAHSVSREAGATG